MTPHEMKIQRNKLRYEWERQTFDAFILPVNELNLTPEEEKAYVRQALQATGRIIWIVMIVSEIPSCVRRIISCILIKIE